MTDISREEEVRAAVERYFDTYFRRRDLAATLASLTPSMHGIGTGAGELCLGGDDSAQFYRRDIEQAPNPVEYTLRRQHASFPADTVAVVACLLDIRTTIAGQGIGFNGLRHTLVLSRDAGDWRVEHIHVSFPADEHDVDEAYPVRELEERNAVLERLVDERTAELQGALERIDVLAHTDALTGLDNRRSIDQALEDALEERERGKSSPLAVLLMDLDRFKRINDEYGHLEGDRILKALAGFLAKAVANPGRVGRWGGEEFVVIAPGLTLEAGAELAESIRQEIHNLRGPGGEPVTASLGVVEARPDDTHESVMARADQALYAAKAGGRNRVERG